MIRREFFQACVTAAFAGLTTGRVIAPSVHGARARVAREDGGLYFVHGHCVQVTLDHAKHARVMCLNCRMTVLIAVTPAMVDEFRALPQGSALGRVIVERFIGLPCYDPA